MAAGRSPFARRLLKGGSSSSLGGGGGRSSSSYSGRWGGASRMSSTTNVRYTSNRYYRGRGGGGTHKGQWASNDGALILKQAASACMGLGLHHASRADRAAAARAAVAAHHLALLDRSAARRLRGHGDVSLRRHQLVHDRRSHDRDRWLPVTRLLLRSACPRVKFPAARSLRLRREHNLSPHDGLMCSIALVVS